MKKRFPPVLFGRDPVSQLYRAIVRYVKANGGHVVVIGGIQTQQRDRESGNYVIAVKCTGKMPTYAEQK